jgi:hypothetical protein
MVRYAMEGMDMEVTLHSHKMLCKISVVDVSQTSRN